VKIKRARELVKKWSSRTDMP